MYPEPKKRPANASEGPSRPASGKGNLRTPVLNKLLSTQRSCAEKAPASARAGAPGLVFVEGIYQTGGQSHTALEPHCCVALWKEGHPHRPHEHPVRPLAHGRAGRALQTAPRSRQCTCEYVSGAFGGKQGLQLEHTTAGRLARVTGRPVRLVLSRHEEMVFGGHRPLTHIELSAVTNDKLEPLGITMRAYGTAGVVQSQSALVGPHDVRRPERPTTST
ncbi:MAG: molybdopterin cofactor-binding domain-containing protein [Polyangiaceae bacterium]